MTTQEKSIFERTVLTVRQLNDLRNKNLIQLPIFQRREVVAWDKPEKRDLFIDSVLMGYHTGLFHSHKIDNVYYNLDGQQRARLFYSVLSQANPYVPVDVVNFPEINNKPFVDWPDNLQVKFLNHELDFILWDIHDDETLSDIFARINRPIPLTNKELNRGKMLENLAKLQNLINSELWTNCPKFTRDHIETIIIQSLAYMHDNFDQKSKTLIDWFCDYKANEDNVKKLAIKLDNFSKIIALIKDNESVTKRILKRIHIQSIVCVLPDMTLNQNQLDNYSSRIMGFYELSRKDRTAERAVLHSSEGLKECPSSSSSSPTPSGTAAPIFSR